MTLSRLILLRHGQTDFNVAGRMQGHLDSVLTPIGRAQAVAAAPVVAELAPDRLISSDLPRAVDTADVVGAACGLPVKLDARLRETHLGEWQGLSVAEIEAEYPGAIATWRSDAAWAPPGRGVPDPGGGAVPAGRRRARRRVRPTAGPETLLVVAHGGLIAGLVSGLLELPTSGWPAIGGLGNCRWAVLPAGRITRAGGSPGTTSGPRGRRRWSGTGTGPADTPYCARRARRRRDRLDRVPARGRCGRASGGSGWCRWRCGWGTRMGREGVDIDAAALSAALADRHLDVQTSRPPPADFATTYRAALADGAAGVVSVHLSRELSGTWEAARLAAEEVGADRVRVVDSRATAMGLGYAVLAAADAAEPGRRRGAWRRQPRTSRPGAGCSSAWTPWTGCAAAAGSARRPRWSARRWR